MTMSNPVAQTGGQQVGLSGFILVFHVPCQSSFPDIFAQGLIYVLCYTKSNLNSNSKMSHSNFLQHLTTLSSCRGDQSASSGHKCTVTP